MKAIDRFLNGITMYKLVLYGLGILAFFAILLGFLGILSFSGVSLLISALLLVFAAEGWNRLFSFIWKAPINRESSAITGLILFFLIVPAATLADGAVLIGLAGIAMLSKYVLALKKRHLFNPAAVAAVVSGFIGLGSVTWWIGSATLLPATAILGFLIVRKLRRFHLFFSFFITALMVLAVSALTLGLPVDTVILQGVVSWPLIFFGTVMLTEPFTTPPTRALRVIYGMIVGGLTTLQFHVGPMYPTPELVLLLGNIFSYFVSSKCKLFLTLKSKQQIANGVYEFSFSSNQKLLFQPGQFLEWTMPLNNPDSRGNRRYFTIASAPTETEIKLGVRIMENGSAFKRELVSLEPGKQLVAHGLSGEFILPKDKNKKLVFIAGGIGITPFRSMIRYLLDLKQKRDIVLFYACARHDDFAYRELFDEAREIGLRTVYLITDPKEAPEHWSGKMGFLTETLLKDAVADYSNRTFYLSGPNAMVENYKKLLLKTGISRSSIKTDYFPGF